MKVVYCPHKHVFKLQEYVAVVWVCSDCDEAVKIVMDVEDIGKPRGIVKALGSTISA